MRIYELYFRVVKTNIQSYLKTQVSIINFRTIMLKTLFQLITSYHSNSRSTCHVFGDLLVCFFLSQGENWFAALTNIAFLKIQSRKYIVIFTREDMKNISLCILGILLSAI